MPYEKEQVVAIRKEMRRERFPELSSVGKETDIRMTYPRIASSQTVIM